MSSAVIIRDIVVILALTVYAGVVLRVIAIVAPRWALGEALRVLQRMEAMRAAWR